MVTAEPTIPEKGVKSLTTGGIPKAKPSCTAVPDVLVTRTCPLDPLPTTAVMLVGELTVNELAGTPPKLTSLTPEKLFPVIVIIVPGSAMVGANEMINGSGTTLLINTDRDWLVVVVTTASSFPSPLISAMAITFI